MFPFSGHWGVLLLQNMVGCCVPMVPRNPAFPLAERVSVVWDVWCWGPWSVQSLAKRPHISTSHAFGRGPSASLNAKRSCNPPSNTHSWENRQNSHIDHQDCMYLSVSLLSPFHSSPCSLAPWQLWSSIPAAVDSMQIERRMWRGIFKEETRKYLHKIIISLSGLKLEVVRQSRRWVAED